MKMKENVIQQMDAVELKEVNGGFPCSRYFSRCHDLYL